jgi:hypothetical protein
MPKEEEHKSVPELIESVKKLLEKEKPKSNQFATVALLVFGTLLTVLSSLTVSYFNNKSSDDQEARRIKYDVIEKLGQDAELRSILCNDLMNAQNDIDGIKRPNEEQQKLFDTIRNRYVLERLHFDAAAVVYQAQLLKYFGENDRKYFRFTIYNGLVDLGNIAELGEGGKAGRAKFFGIRNQLEDNIQAFCNKLYLEVK